MVSVFLGKWNVLFLQNIHRIGLSDKIFLVLAGFCSLNSCASQLKGSDLGFALLFPSQVSSETSLRFLAVGMDHRHTLSADGQAWEHDTYISRINAVAHCNSRTVSVGERGRIAYSSGVSSVEVGGFQDKELEAVTCGNGVFIAVGADGLILRSTDGQTWTDESDSVNAGSNTFRGVASDNVNRFVAVGYSGRVVVSTDGGLNWGNLQNVDSESLYGIVFGGGAFIAVGASGKRMSSADGINWNNKTTGGGRLRGVAYGAGVFIAVGDNERRIRSADNGVSWSNDLSDAWYTYYSVAYDPVEDYFFTVGTYGRRRHTASGVIWTAPNAVTSSDFTLRAVVYNAGDDYLLAVGSNNRFTKNQDSATWFDDSWTDENFNNVVYGDAGFVGVGTRGLRCHSADGVSWTTCLTGGDDLHDVAWGDGLYVAVGVGGRRMISPDGIHWSNEISGGGRLRSITYGKGYFVSVGSSGRRLRSPDGINWTDDMLGGDNLRGIAFGDGIFVAVGDNKRRVRSSDGQTWTDDVSSGDDLEAISYDESAGQFVAVGECLRVMSSPDGINWTDFGTVSGSQTYYDIACESGICVAAGSDGLRKRSQDGGVTWSGDIEQGALFFGVGVRPPSDP